MMKHFHCLRFFSSSLLWFLASGPAPAQHLDASSRERDGRIDAAADGRASKTPSAALSHDQWRRVDASVERALNFLAAQQRPDGSFPTLRQGQPAVTSFCVLAFMAHGHNPGDGPYGRRLERAVDFIVSCQWKSGLIALVAPEGRRIDRNVTHGIGTTVVYNHAIASLTLSEIYGMGHAKRTDPIRNVLNQSLQATLEMQRWPKNRSWDEGGWRYLDDDDAKDSDLSVTGWQLMFLRSARDAGFDVPKERIDDAVGYVRRSFDKSHGAFNYTISRKDGPSRGMAGAGILALGHAGFHDSYEAQRSAQTLMRYSFELYNDNLGLNGDRYHYSLVTCCYGMYQLGSPYWEQFFPRVVSTLLSHQRRDGSWEPESDQRDRPFGNSYTTALVVLSLGAPNQLLPIFQR
jgi:hypothetical protein